MVYLYIRAWVGDLLSIYLLLYEKFISSNNKNSSSLPDSKYKGNAYYQAVVSINMLRGI